MDDSTSSDADDEEDHRVFFSCFVTRKLFAENIFPFGKGNYRSSVCRTDRPVLALPPSAVLFGQPVNSNAASGLMLR